MARRSQTAASPEAGPAGAPELSAPDDVPAALRALRARLGLSQQELAARLGVAKLSVLRWEHGRTRPSPALWSRIASLIPPTAARAAPLQAAASEPAGAPPGNAFIGREAELAAIGGLLGETRLLTLTGPAGCGKTRLAFEAAARFGGRYRDGVLVLELAALADREALLYALADRLRVQERPGTPLLETLAAALGARQLLLLLDNCEHVLDACAQLA
ncbi:MAG TPA: helix-turn-helix domain-containing protein, partial [Dehalococcoidia bacterium]|nr:helix-turn-helix domain-containing protein [Dehalococcoidia bacterium]